MRHVVVMMLTLALLATLGGPRASADKPAENLDGTWVTQSRSMGGKPFGGDDVKRTKVVIKGNTFTITFNDEKLGVRTITIDATKTPKTIDMIPQGLPSKQFRGIYKREGDTLTICLGYPNQPRPTAFDNKQGLRTELTVYKLQK